MITLKVQLSLVHLLVRAGITLLVFLKITVNAQEIREDIKNHPNWEVLDRGDDCGHNFADRIIGGSRANLGQYPWIVRLGYSRSFDADCPTIDLFQCGGVIISDRYILTAAHCSPDFLGLNLVKIRIGEFDATTEKDCMDGVCAPPLQDMDIEEYSCHTGYDWYHLQDDICLIRLAEPIKFNDFTSPICLPVYDIFQNESFAGTVMEVAGWGITNIVTRQTSDILLTLRVPVITPEECVAAYTGRAEITDQQICAGGVIGKDSCGGDSGGPLMKPFAIGAPPRYFVVGVVSFGPKNCGTTKTPGVYTKLSEYMTWILNNVRE